MTDRVIEWLRERLAIERPIIEEHERDIGRPIISTRVKFFEELIELRTREINDGN